MPFYSLVVWTPCEIQIRTKGILLDPGTNAFNVQVDDNLDELIAAFDAAGARIVQSNKLDDHEAIEPDPEIAQLLAAGTKLTLPTGDK